MTVKSDVRYVNSKRDKTKKVKKTTYKCEGSYVDIDGNPHRYHKRGFATAEEAKEWERTFLIGAKNIISSEITFGELFSLFIESKQGKIKDKSISDFKNIANNHILPFWRDVKLSKIDLNQIEKWQTGLLNKKYKYNKNAKKEYSNSRIILIQTRFKQVLKYGITRGYIKDTKIGMFKSVKRTDEIKKEMLFWQPNEFYQFISCVDDVVYIAFFNVLYWCGLRLGEALALNWSDVDLDKKIIYVRKSYSKYDHKVSSPKTSNSNRNVLIPNQCLEALSKLNEKHKKYIGFNKERFLFDFIKPLDENTIRRNKNKWCQEANVKQIRIHDFRHSHVSLLINLGFSPFDIAKRLGHTVEMVNNVYGHWFTDAQQNMVDKLSSVDKHLV